MFMIGTAMRGSAKEAAAVCMTDPAEEGAQVWSAFIGPSHPAA